MGVLFLLLLARPVAASGPDPGRPIKQMRHTVWNEASGLGGVVYSLVQTGDGFLWIGTSMGLYRFDGMKFDSYLELAPNQVMSDVRTLLASRDGGLWIGYRSGVAFLKQDKVSFYTERQGLPYGRVSSLAQTQDGAIWAAVASSGGGKAQGGQDSLAGLARFSNGNWERIGIKWNYTANSAEKVVVDSAGTLWVTGGESVRFLPRGGQTFQETGVKVSAWTEACTGPDGSVWIADATAHKLFNFRKSPEVGYFSITADPLQDINDIRFDSAHSLWLATGRGLYRIPSGSIKALPKQTNSQTEKDQFMAGDGMSGREVHAVLEDREGNIWIGTTNGLDRFSDRSVTQFNIGHTPSDLIVGPHSEVWASQFSASPYLIPLHDCKPFLLHAWYTRSFFMDRTGILWAAMQAGPTWESRGLWKDKDGITEMVPSPPEMKGPLIDGIVGDATGRLWMTIRGYGEYTLENGKWEKVPVFTGSDFDLAPDAQFVDANGRAWLVYYARNTVVMIDGTKRTFFTAGEGLDLGNPIVGWASGTQVWISGTTGLGFFDGERFQNIRALDGSQFRNATAVIPTERDGLWLKVPEGVVQIPQDQLEGFFHDHSHAVRYRIFDGATDFVAQLARYGPAASGTDAVRSGDGKLWFSVSTGVAMIDPAHLAKNDLAPPVFISKLAADGRIYVPYGDVILPKSTREVSLDYTALSLTLSERNRFRYQLIGVDKEWRDVGSRRQAFYTNLAPGTYTFKVKAANNDGVWNEAGVSITFRIPPTFFQTIWFKSLLVLILALLLWILFLIRLRQSNMRTEARLREVLMERERIARDLHDTLLQGFQMLLLRFQVITDTLVADNPAKSLLEESLLRSERTLQEGRDRVSALRAEAESAEDLTADLRQFGQQLSSGSSTTFQFSVEGTPTALQAVVHEEVRMIAREVITNAFRHAGATRIECQINFARRHFVFLCSDNGRGISEPEVNAKESRKHWGLVGIRERSRKIGAVLRIGSAEPSGTKIELTLSARIAYAANMPKRRWFAW